MIRDINKYILLRDAWTVYTVVTAAPAALVKLVLLLVHFVPAAQRRARHDQCDAQDRTWNPI